MIRLNSWPGELTCKGRPTKRLRQRILESSETVSTVFRVCDLMEELAPIFEAMSLSINKPIIFEKYLLEEKGDNSFLCKIRMRNISNLLPVSALFALE